MDDMQLEQIFLHQKDHSQILRKSSAEERREHLDILEKMILKIERPLLEALRKDFSKPEFETQLTEIHPTLQEIRHARKNLARWMKPQHCSTPATLLGSRSHIIPEPRGVCLLISPWNYPFQLLMSPLISAIAAGNCAFLKPSEHAPYTSAVMAEAIKESFAENHITVLEGGIATTQALLKLPFDHIFFTGSTHVGKIIMKAASEHLSSVTLELGGKSPTIVDASADILQAAERIIWAKFLNAGQTCVAPDYILAQTDIYEELKLALQHRLQQCYGPTPEIQKSSRDFARIISMQHTQRLHSLLAEAQNGGAHIITGGQSLEGEHFLSPTLIEKVPSHSKLMQEEIFGPILPLIPFKEISEAIHYINERPKPLALYLYSQSQMNQEEVLRGTSSGGLCINDSLIHLANPHLPFGGIGPSGMGASHGHHGFRSFSHEKAVFVRRWGQRLMRWTYPPYTAQKMNLLNWLRRF
ncbi:MAG: aldehyde dehydrogenase family protein [Bdellovibrio sp.]